MEIIKNKKVLKFMPLICLASNVVKAEDEGFFDDYPKTINSLRYLTKDAIDGTNTFVGWAWTIIRWAWILLTLFSILTFIISVARLAIHADDIPLKKSRDKNDMAISLILLMICGGFPLLVSLILSLLNIWAK